MEPILLLAIAALGIGGFVVLTDYDNDEPNADEEVEVSEDEQVVNAGDGDDTVTGMGDLLLGVDIQTNGGADELTGLNLMNSTVSSGANNDVVDITLINSELTTGEGDDTVAAELYGTVIDAGAGNDMITVTGAVINGGQTCFSNVSGGAGDDTITTQGETYANGTTILDGGDGNDVVDGSGTAGLHVLGGAGDDVLYSSVTWDDSGPVRTEGGDGNDTLHIDTDPTVNFAGGIASGGAGADVFNVSVASTFSSDGGASDALSITDFEPGVDVLELTPENLYQSVSGFGAISDADPRWTEDDIPLTGFIMAEVGDADNGDADNGDDTTISLFYDVYDATTGDVIDQVTTIVTLQAVTGLTLADITVT